MPADTQRCAFPGGWAGIIGKRMAEDKNRWRSLFRISQWQRQEQNLQYQILSPHLTPTHGCNSMFLFKGFIKIKRQCPAGRWPQGRVGKAKVPHWAAGWHSSQNTLCTLGAGFLLGVVWHLAHSGTFLNPPMQPPGALDA